MTRSRSMTRLACLVWLAGCGDLPMTEEEVEADLNEGPPPKVIDTDATVLETGLERTVYKGIATSNSNFYALTTYGIKRVAHTSASLIDTSGYLRRITLDVIDYVNAEWGVVGALSKGTNASAKLALKADTASPIWMNLPPEVTTVYAIQAQELYQLGIPLGELRIFVKTLSGSSRVVHEYRYLSGGAGVTRLSTTTAEPYHASGIALPSTVDAFVGYGGYTYQDMTKYRVRDQYSVTENARKDRDYPGGTVTAVHQHGFAGTNGPTQVSAYQMDYGPFNAGTAYYYYFLSGDTSTTYALVRLPSVSVSFRKQPAYEPGYWNVTNPAMNNCYNYAANKRTDTDANPGRGTDYEVWDGNGLTVQEIVRAAEVDGLEYLGVGTPGQLPAIREGKALIAGIVGVNFEIPTHPDIWPYAGDYHFYRLDRNGPYWSHKPGDLPATDLDFAGQKITDPRTAAWDRTRYDTFVGFFAVDSNDYQGMGTEGIR